MKRTMLILGVASALAHFGACKKGGADEKKASAEEGGEAESAPEPFTGELTGEVIQSAEGVVEPFTPWEQGLAKVKAKLGEPTSIEESEYRWGAVEGDSCAYFFIERDDAGNYFDDEEREGEMIVGAVSRPTTVEKDGPEKNWEACLAAAGQEPEEEPEDPEAAAFDLSEPVKVADLQEAFAGAPKSLSGKTARVSGSYVSHTVAKAKGSGDASVTVTVAGKDGADVKLGCYLAEPNVPEKTQGDPILVEGELVERFDEASLDDCRVLE